MYPPVMAGTPARVPARIQCSVLLCAFAASFSTFKAAAESEQVTQLPTVEATAKPSDMRPSSSSSASRLGLSLDETPATLEILTQEDIQERGLRTSREAFADVVGSIAGNVPGNPAVVGMRGFSGNAISVLQDGTRVSTSTFVTRDVNTWHFEKIEVLKGPASVLYGEGALAGVINKVTRKPSLEGNARDGLLSYGSFNTLTMAGGLNQKLSETTAVRFDVSEMKSDSLYDVDNNKTRSTGMTGSVLFKPTPKLSALFAIDHYDDRYDSSYQGLPLVDRSVARDPSDALSSSTNNLVVDRALRHKNYNPAGSTSGARDTTIRSRLDYSLDQGWSLASDLSWYTAKRDFILSADQNYTAPSAGFPNGSFARNVQRFYHDQKFWNLRTMASNDSMLADMRNRFSVGVEYNDTDFDSLRQQTPIGGVAAVDPFDPAVGVVPPNDSAYTASNALFATGVKTKAIFVEDALNLTPGWLLVGGIRYEDIALDRDVINYNAAGAVTSASPDYQPLPWRIGTTYDVAPDITVYSQYTTAVVPVSSILTLSIANSAFKLTSGRASEAGIKARFLKDRVNATLAFYSIEQDDILTSDPTNPSVAVQGGQLQSRGAELSLSAQVVRQLRVSAGASYTAAEYASLVEFVGGVPTSRSGNRPINIPEVTAQFSAIYRLTSVPLSLGTFVRHVSDFYTDTANTYLVRGRTTLDASATYRLSSKLELGVRGRNLTDAFYGEYSGYPSTNIYIGAPRSAELSLTARF